MKKIFNSKFLIFNLISHPLFSGSFIMIFGSNAVSFLNYLYHLIMVRMLGPASYGELAAIISFYGLLGILPVSLNLVVIKYVSSLKDEKELSSLVIWLKRKTMIWSLLFSFLIIILAPLISSFLRIHNFTYLVFVGLLFLFSTQALFNRSVLQGLLKFKEMVISIMAENLIKLFLSVLLVYLGFNVGGAMVGLTLSALLGWNITNLFLNYKGKSMKLEVNVKEIFSFTVPVFVQSMAITSLYSSDVILVKHFFPAYEAGVYASVSTLGKIIFFGAGPIGAVMFPLVSRRYSRKGGYKRVFLYSVAATALLAAGVLLLYWFFPDLIIKLLFGMQNTSAAGLLFWFGVFISVFTLSSLLISYGLALGKTSIVFFPLAAALSQVIIIWFNHPNLFAVIRNSIVVCALLLAFLLIYLGFQKEKQNGD